MAAARALRALGVGLALVGAGAAPAAALDWGGIVPAVTTMAQVRARYGAPSQTSTQTLQGVQAQRWVYAADLAPPGFSRMTVDFGLRGADGYHPDLVRALTLEPRPGIFTRPQISAGWGPADRVGREGDTEILFYYEGLVVYFAPDGWNVRLMLFTPPQPRPPSPR